MCLIPIVKLFLIQWSRLRFVPFTWTGYQGTRWVWPVDRGCLLLLGTWVQQWYIQRSVFTLFLDLYFLQDCLLFQLLHPWILFTCSVSVSVKFWWWNFTIEVMNVCFPPYYVRRVLQWEINRIYLETGVLQNPRFFYVPELRIESSNYLSICRVFVIKYA
jgi:hypothetical protein